MQDGGFTIDPPGSDRIAPPSGGSHSVVLSVNQDTSTWTARFYPDPASLTALGITHGPITIHGITFAGGLTLDHPLRYILTVTVEAEDLIPPGQSFGYVIDNVTIAKGSLLPPS